MESYVSVIADQVLVMLLLMAAGFFSYKVKIISNEGSKQITNILILLVSPVVIFVSYQRDFDPEMLKGLAQAFGIALLGFAIAMAGAYLLLRAKGKEGKAALAVERFSVIYSNCGFIGIPLVQALFGNEGVFYLTAVMTAFNILVWTHGLFLFTGGEKFSIKGLLKALCSPSIQMKSKPQPAIISVTKGLSKPTWDPMASLPAATLSVILCALYMGNSSFSNK